MSADDDGLVSRFICTGCDSNVTALGLTVCLLPPVCGTCAWLDEFVPFADERATIRAMLTGEGACHSTH